MLKRSTLRVSDTAVLHLKDASGRPMFYTPPASSDAAEVEKRPVLITIYGPGSAEYLDAQQAAQRRFLALTKDGQDLQARGVAERARDVADLLAAITAGIEGIDLEGKPLDIGMHELYADPACGYIVAQVNAFAAEWSNFSHGAPKA